MTLYEVTRHDANEKSWLYGVFTSDTDAITAAQKAQESYNAEPWAKDTPAHFTVARAEADSAPIPDEADRTVIYDTESVTTQAA